MKKMLNTLIIFCMISVSCNLLMVNTVEASTSLTSSEETLLKNAFGISNTKDAVKELQIRVGGWVKDANYTGSPIRLVIDGIMGPNTRQAIKNFQSAYNISATGTINQTTLNTINSLESSDDSTSHFSWNEFRCKGSSTLTWNVWHEITNITSEKALIKTIADNRNISYTSLKWMYASQTEIKENVRRVMWRLEALRKKIGSKPINLTSGFRYWNYHFRSPNVYGGNTSNVTLNSMHLYGAAADIYVSGYSNTSLKNMAKTCGFTGGYSEGSFVHIDIRSDLGKSAWWQ
ncbi:peptidoglycan-binding protein [Vallitalea pronyensis]|uniref:Peptidoglycan-binding protein n=1 Tax=Vallitalea pronyensis TaxID=1348613 RepID=A0A8J8MMB1_9FIRM|nr:M15 family metallopeptidase [Vallitalea pronyensis]QUI24482.1 peptidoglycan-binding protein [Vallitalea pronyensis]